tara:strand:+ start:227 stop:745 length:519 start_codon:yes stop_codon:yes gene_type:complete
MAKQVIGIGTVANDGTGDPLRTAFDKANDNFTELYNAAAPVDSVNGQTGVVVLDSDDITEGATNEYLLADSVTYAKLGTEFTTSYTLPVGNPMNVDFSSAQVFVTTLSADTTISFSNQAIGMVKDLVITGNYVLTLPAGSTVAGTYDGTVENLIQIVATGAGQYWYSISQAI